MRKKSFFVYLSLILILGLLSVEGLLRATRSQPFLSFQHYYPNGVVAFKPHLNGEISGFPKDKLLVGRILRAYRVPIKTNSRGFLGDKEFNFEKTGRRIISLGGSVSMAWPFGLEASYGTHLEKSNLGLEVIQAPQIGTSLAHMYEHYRKISSQFQADVLLVQSRPSMMEVDDLIQDTFGQDAFELAELKNWGVSPKTSVDGAGNPQIETLSADLVEKINDKLYLGSRTLFKFYQWSHIFRAILNSRSPSAFLKDYLSHAPDTSRRPQKSLAYLTGLRDLARANGTELLYIVIPNRYGCSSGVVNSWRNFLKFADAAQVKSITFFDQFCDLKEFKPLESEFLPDEFHPTRAAYQKISERIEKEVAALLAK